MPTFVLFQIVATLLASATIAFACACFVRRTLTCKVLALLCAAWLLVDAFVLRESVWLIRWIPWTNMLVLGDFVPLGAAVLAAMLIKLSTGKLVYRATFATILVASCLLYSYGEYLRPRPPIEARWRYGVCMQTTNASCGAAAAATLLAMHGISSTESEMADLCFTGDDGTTMQGLYRGLRLKTAGTAREVQPFTGNLETLRADPQPTLLAVGLGRWQKADPQYSNNWGWTPGIMHSVVFTGMRGADEV